MWNFRGIYEGRKMDNVIYSSHNFLLRCLRYSQKSKKLNIICSGIHIDFFRKVYIKRHDKRFLYDLDDYNLPYGDIIEMYLPYSKRSLDEIGKELANIINYDKDFEAYNSIILIGVGEGGICFVNMAKYLKRQVRIATIATPFNGTRLADIKYVESNLNKGIKKDIYYMLEERYNFKNNEIANGSDLLLRIDYNNILLKHRWINFVVDSKKCKMRPENIIEKFFGWLIYHYESDGVTLLISQKILATKNNGINICIHATLYDALLVALEYFRS